MTIQQYDLIIIGSGGGTKLRPAADQGKKVAIIEKDHLGGTCLNRGCIPSKMLIYPGELLTHAKDLKKYGIDVENTDHSIRWKDLVGRTNISIQADSSSIERAYAEHKFVDYYHGHARFVSPHVVEVDGVHMTAPNIYIATGTRPSIAPIPGLEGTPYWTSTEALNNDKQPKTLVVIGGGYIAMELGMFYANIGTKTTFVARSGLLRAEDKDIRNRFEEYTCGKYDVRMHTSTQQVEYKDGMFHTTIQEKEGGTTVLISEALLVATGVTPNSDDLGLEHTSIKRDERGSIKVNEYMETHEQGVYALGDVVGKYMFRHSVNFEGEYLFGQRFGGQSKSPIAYPPMPHAVFSTPQIAGVGITEDELQLMGKTEGDDYVVAMHEYASSAMGMAMLPEVGMVKLIFDVQSKQLIGAHILGEKASDLIHMLILAISMQATVDDLHKMIYIHPALAEVIRNAVRKAQQALG